MSDFVDELLTQHGEIREALRMVAGELGNMRVSGTPDWALLRGSMGYLTQYPDLFHHACEDMVFQRLHQRDRESRQFVRDLMREHGLPRELGLDFLEVCEAISDGAIVPMSRVDGCGRRYLAFQQRHMRKEEETVFPRIRYMLTPDDWVEVEHAFDRMAPVLANANQVREQFRALHAHLQEHNGRYATACAAGDRNGVP